MRYWKRVHTEGNSTTVESYSHNLDVEGAIEISEDEFNTFIASLPAPILESIPSRDLATEIDDLEARVEKLEKK